VTDKTLGVHHLMTYDTSTKRPQYEARMWKWISETEATETVSLKRKHFDHVIWKRIRKRNTKRKQKNLLFLIEFSEHENTVKLIILPLTYAEKLKATLIAFSLISSCFHLMWIVSNFNYLGISQFASFLFFNFQVFLLSKAK